MGKGTWTDTERDLMEQIYPEFGADGCLAVMPNHSRGAITQQACKMGLSKSYDDENATPVPTHDYTPPDYALRGWAYPVSPGLVGGRIGL